MYKTLIHNNISIAYKLPCQNSYRKSYTYNCIDTKVQHTDSVPGFG